MTDISEPYRTQSVRELRQYAASQSNHIVLPQAETTSLNVYEHVDMNAPVNVYDPALYARPNPLAHHTLGMHDATAFVFDPNSGSYEKHTNPWIFLHHQLGLPGPAPPMIEQPVQYYGYAPAATVPTGEKIYTGLAPSQPPPPAPSFGSAYNAAPPPRSSAGKAPSLTSPLDWQGKPQPPQQRPSFAGRSVLGVQNQNALEYIQRSIHQMNNAEELDIMITPEEVIKDYPEYKSASVHPAERKQFAKVSVTNRDILEANRLMNLTYNVGDMPYEERQIIEESVKAESSKTRSHSQMPSAVPAKLGLSQAPSSRRERRISEVSSRRSRSEYSVAKPRPFTFRDQQFFFDLTRYPKELRRTDYSSFPQKTLSYLRYPKVQYEVFDSELVPRKAPGYFC